MPPATTWRLVLEFGIPFALVVIAARFALRRLRFRSYGVTLLVASALYTLILVAALVLATYAVRQRLDVLLIALREPLKVTLQYVRAPDSSSPQEGASVYFIPLLACFFAFFYIEVLTITGIRAVASKLGGLGVFWNWIRGYYHNPQQEQRIFMFLDLRGSTSLAEQLGDVKFSALVRDFFDDLTDPVQDTCGQVSHYIGDEAVITWRANKGIESANCIQCFFRAQRAIERRRQHYVEHFRVVPQFKAGVHIGTVVATEVGRIKSEIVYHGDVLNTAARVQGACNELDTDLLLTSDLADRLPQLDWLKLCRVGEVSLKGKAEKVVLYAAAVTEP